MAEGEPGISLRARARNESPASGVKNPILPYWSIQCAECGVTFERRSMRGRQPKYCSAACRVHACRVRQGKAVPTGHGWRRV